MPRKPSKDPTTSVAAVEKKIARPVADWVGNCYGIASLCVDLGVVKGRAVYGHFLGTISPDGHFPHQADHVFARHGWVVLPDGRVWDPTRWAFEGKKPFIFLGDGKDYDEGGNAIRRALMKPAPLFDETDKVYSFSKHRLSSEAWAHVEKLVQPDYSVQIPGDLSCHQVMWLATLPFDMLEPHAREIYQAIAKLDGHSRAFIPVDNRRRVGIE